MNATSATCADEDGEDDDDGEAADMEGSVSFLPNCRLATMFVSAGCVFVLSEYEESGLLETDEVGTAPNEWRQQVIVPLHSVCLCRQHWTPAR